MTIRQIDLTSTEAQRAIRYSLLAHSSQFIATALDVGACGTKAGPAK